MYLNENFIISIFMNIINETFQKSGKTRGKYFATEDFEVGNYDLPCTLRHIFMVTSFVRRIPEYPNVLPSTLSEHI